MMASINRRQPPAWHTKVVDSHSSPVKKGGTHKNSKTRSCNNEAMSSKPSSGRGVVNDMCTMVSKCGKTRCKTCSHVDEEKYFC